MYTEYKRLKAKEAFQKIRAMLSDDELDEIRKSSEEFRKNFKLRGSNNAI